MSKRPWYKRYGGDFIAGTMGMSLEERGAYSLLLDMMYDRGKPVPDDAKYISHIMGVNVRRWNRIRERLITLDKIAAEDGALTNLRFKLSQNFDETLSEVRSRAGKKGGQKSAAVRNKNNDVDEANGEAKNNQTGKQNSSNLTRARGLDAREYNSVSDSSLRSESSTSPRLAPSPGDAGLGKPAGQVNDREVYRDARVGRLRYADNDEPVYPDVKLHWRHNPAHPDSDFTGPKWLDQHDRPCTEEGELLVTPDTGGEPEATPEDWKKILFGPCLTRFADCANKAPGQMRSLVGKWLKEIGGDAQAEALVRIMDDAAQTPKADRIAWVNRAILNRRKARRESLVG